MRDKNAKQPDKDTLQDKQRRWREASGPLGQPVQSEPLGQRPANAPLGRLPEPDLRK